MEKKYIYSQVKILLEMEIPGKKSEMILESYVRLLHRKKYYICKIKISHDIIFHGIHRETDIISLLNQFHGEVYRMIKLMKVDVKLIIPGYHGTDKPVFELDPDQTDERERLIPKI